MDSQLDTHELAWAGGFFCGEGCVTASPSTQRRKYRTYLNIGQSGDTENLERFQAAIGGIGFINGPFNRSSKFITKPQYAWSVSSFEGVQATIAMLWSWLSTEKQDRAIERLLAQRNDRPRITSA